MGQALAFGLDELFVSVERGEIMLPELRPALDALLDLLEQEAEERREESHAIARCEPRAALPGPFDET